MMTPRHQHGGQLRAASERYGIPVDAWLDLSTGISPFVYPLPPVPTACWQRLPEADDGLEAAAAAYYGSASLLAVAGSQEAIQRLPLLRTAGKVGVVSPAYHSHQQAWQQAGHELLRLSAAHIEAYLDELDVLLLVNPNNPTATHFSVAQLQSWHARLAARGGWLVVDEAYQDSTPAQSLIQSAPQTGLIVLRSVGKFFGLAGIRLGFVWASATILQALAALQDDWAVSHPARWAGKLALQDTAWQAAQRQRLSAAGQRLQVLLQQAFPHTPVQASTLFAYCPLTTAWPVYEQLAQAGILVRYFAEPAALRFGLPQTEAAWRRLEDQI